MRYDEFLPPPRLARYVRCVWTFEAGREENTARERIVPDGRCELIVHIGDPFMESSIDKVETEQPRVLFAGQLSQPLWLHARAVSRVGTRPRGRDRDGVMSQTSKRTAKAAGYDAAMKTLLAAFTLVATIASAQQPARVASLDWMTGTWTQSRGDEIVTESWLGPGNGVMVAVNLTTRGPSRKTFEFLRIADTSEGFSYFASPAGRAPVEFKLKEHRGQRVMFENAAHDFPQRILYWRDGDALVARIEGTIGGAEKSREWRFSRVR